MLFRSEKKLQCLHRALTSTPSNTFGMNWNTDCKLGLLVQHQCLASVHACWTKWAQIPADTPQYGIISYPRRVKDFIGGNSILMPMVLEWDDQLAHIGERDRFPHSFSHIEYRIYSQWFQILCDCSLLLSFLLIQLRFLLQWRLLR